MKIVMLIISVGTSPLHPLHPLRADSDSVKCNRAIILLMIRQLVGVCIGLERVFAFLEHELISEVVGCFLGTVLELIVRLGVDPADVLGAGSVLALDNAH